VILTFVPEEVAPDRAHVFENLGIPPGAEIQDRIEDLYAAAAAIFAETVAPAGVIVDIPRSEFGDVYRGEGRNEPNAPVGDIFPRADRLALFVVTLGEQTSQAIARGFNLNDFALASMLDAMASAAADGTADLAERRYEDLLTERGWDTPDGAALRYSPGYCGWHVTGQRRLFQYLEPEQIGVTLTDSCLMQPLKSVSGVMIAGPREIHRFPPTYEFCSRCETRSCRERIRQLFIR
jgi:hypothetical protein